MPELTPKRVRFVQEYLIDLNATQAAIRAGYSAKTADRIGPELLGKTCVAAAIAQAQQDRGNRLQVDQDWVLARLVRIAGSDAGQVMSWGPNGVNVVPSHKLPDDVRYAVSEVSESATKEGDILIKVKLSDKLAALQLVGKHLGMFVDKHEILLPQADILARVAVQLHSEGFSRAQIDKVLNGLRENIGRDIGRGVVAGAIDA